MKNSIFRDIDLGFAKEENTYLFKYSDRQAWTERGVWSGSTLFASQPAFLDTIHITKTGLYNFDPLKPHFYIVKLGLTGVYIIFFLFFFLLENIDCGYS